MCRPGFRRERPGLGAWPFGLQSLPPPRLVALRVPCLSHVTAMRSHAARAGGAYEAYTASPLLCSREGMARPFSSPCGALLRRTVVLETVSVVVPLSLIAHRSRPSLLVRSMAAGLDGDDEAVTCNVSRQPARTAPYPRYAPVMLALETPVVMPPCSGPKPRHRPAGRSLRGDS